MSDNDLKQDEMPSGPTIPAAAKRKQRTYPIRWHLVVLVVGSLTPVLLFAISVVHQLSQKDRLQSERQLVQVARGVAAVVDREISSTARTLQALSESRSLDNGNIKAFAAEVRRMAKTQPTWLTVILATPDGRQLVNSAQPSGAPAGYVNDPESLREVVSTRRPTVGNITMGRKGRWAFAIRVPVLRAGELRYVVCAVLTPRVLLDAVTREAPAEGEWTRSVVDRQGAIVVRTRDPERFTGKPASLNYRQNIRAGTEGIFASTTLDGVPVRTAFCRLKTTPWTASVSVPVAILEAPERRAMAMVLGLGAGLLLISSLGAYFVARQISYAMTSAALAADALAKGEMPYVHNAGIGEMDVLGEALAHSSRLLAQHEQERDQHLKQVELARDEAETANRLKDYFLATLSHEIRSPLTAILGLASLLRMEKLDRDATLTSLETIERNAQLLSRLVGDLLDMSRITAGKLHLQLEPTKVVDVITSAVEAVRPAAQAKNITIKFEANTSERVMADSDRLQQIFWNLLSNSIKFTPDGGAIELRVSHDDKNAIIEIQDNGIGIKEELLPYIFERFRQGDGSDTRKFGGLGLGLAIVRDLVELHGGSVEARSVGSGAGSTFVIKLPLADNLLSDHAVES